MEMFDKAKDKMKEMGNDAEDKMQDWREDRQDGREEKLDEREEDLEARERAQREMDEQDDMDRPMAA